MSEKIKNIVIKGDVYIKDFIFNECAQLLDEQRKMSVQFKLRDSMNKLRGIQLREHLIVEFLENISKIDFIETEQVKEFKQNIADVIKYYNIYNNNTNE